MPVRRTAPLGIDPSERYEGDGEVIGIGGMGEVRLFVDRKIGREVAMKLLRGGCPARFLREARVQGQLEHPSIVPLYDIGVDEHAQAYFTMRRVRGTTLQRLLRAPLHDPADRHDGEREQQSYKLHRLLSAFGQVCLAVDFAHSRGVIHRDLKPANIMLGPFGEVYVLDWGLAKLNDDISVEEPISDVHLVRGDGHDGREGESSRGDTRVGDCIGTPGYMSPEQIRNEDVDARADVYALGSILFEILTLAPLHPGLMDSRLIATLEEVDVRERLRACRLSGHVSGIGDEETELVSIVERAVRLDREERYRSAREVFEAIEAYLDGRRDHARCRNQAAAHARSAMEAVDRALTPEDPVTPPPQRSSLQHRRDAMRAISAALALDPTNELAMNALVRLVVDRPREVPAEVSRELASECDEGRKRSARIMPIAALAFFIGLPMAILSGVHDVPLFVAINVSWAAAIAAQLAWARWGKFSHALLTLPLWCVAIALFGRVFGSYVLTSGVACALTAAFVLHTQNRRRRAFIVAMMTLSVAAPAALERLGVIAPSYAFEQGRMIVLPRVHDLAALPMQLTLFLSSILLVALPAIFLGRVRDAAEESRQRQLLTVWHLRQFLPSTSTPTTDKTP